MQPEYGFVNNKDNLDNIEHEHTKIKITDLEYDLAKLDRSIINYYSTNDNLIQ